MNIRDRLMSRASVGVMAAFAPKPEGAAAAPDTSKVGQPEKVEDSATDDAGGGDDMGLSAQEQADFDAMASGKAPASAESDIDPAGTVVSDDTVGDVGDGEDEDGEAEPGAAADGAADGAAADAPADGERAPRAPKTISYGRHRKDVDRLQKQLDAATAETAKEREQRLRLDERTNLLLQAIQTKAPAAPVADPAAAAAAADPEPDAEADPIGHLQWQNRGLQREVKELSTGRQQEQRMTAEQQEEAATYRTYEADLTREAAADPTFADAFVHLRETRYRELGFIYADIDINDPAQCARLSAADQVKLSDGIQRSFHNEQMLVAREAMRNNKSPAKVVANLAKARGWEPKAAPTAGAAAPAAPARPANGAAPPVRQVAPAAPGSVKDQLDAIREGTEASRSLSDAGGSPGGGVTPERIANMSDDEFEQFYNQMPKGQFDRQVLGKPAPS